MNYYQVYLEKRDSLFVLWESIDIDTLWKDVGMNGEYVGTLSFINEAVPQYEFILSDNGDVLVTVADISKYESFFDVSFDENQFFYKRYGHFMGVRMKQCFDSRFDDEITVANKNAVFCDYLIIRHDGTIEYGPKSGDL